MALINLLKLKMIIYDSHRIRAKISNLRQKVAPGNNRAAVIQLTYPQQDLPPLRIAVDWAVWSFT